MLTAAQRASINWIAFDDQHLYYLQRQQGCRSPIMRVPKSGGTPETVVYDATPATSVLLGNGKLFWTSGPSSTVLRSLDL